jgi:hypothetical protein
MFNLLSVIYCTSEAIRVSFAELKRNPAEVAFYYRITPSAKQRKFTISAEQVKFIIFQKHSLLSLFSKTQDVQKALIETVSGF